MQIYVKLFCGLIYREIKVLHSAIEKLSKSYGPIDFESEVFNFDHTEYYASEMGTELIRKFISFEKLVHPGKLAEIKIRTIEIEKDLAQKEGGALRRTINIDPGYLELSKIVLASTKNFSHRIYLDKGIFAEVTLLRKDDKFRFLPWTYPDYVHPATHEFLEAARNKYKSQLPQNS